MLGRILHAFALACLGMLGGMGMATILMLAGSASKDPDWLGFSGAIIGGGLGGGFTLAAGILAYRSVERSIEAAKQLHVLSQTDAMTDLKEDLVDLLDLFADTWWGIDEALDERNDSARRNKALAYAYSSFLGTMPRLTKLDDLTPNVEALSRPMQRQARRLINSMRWASAEIEKGGIVPEDQKDSTEWRVRQLFAARHHLTFMEFYVRQVAPDLAIRFDGRTKGQIKQSSLAEQLLDNRKRWFAAKDA